MAQPDNDTMEVLVIVRFPELQSQQGEKAWEEAIVDAVSAAVHADKTLDTIAVRPLEYEDCQWIFECGMPMPDYGVTVGQDGSLVTIGAVGELILSTPQPSCSGVGVLLPNPVVGYDELQAAVAIPRAQLASTGDVTRHFTMAGSGLYAGEALDGSCNSTSCDTQNCTTAAAAGGGSNSGGGSSSCSFTESYSGTIEVRVVR